MRGGRVRCGTCHQPFSALDSLEEIPEDDHAPGLSPGSRAVEAPAPGSGQSGQPSRQVEVEAPIVMPAVSPLDDHAPVAVKPEGRTDEDMAAATDVEIPEPPAVVPEGGAGSTHLAWLAGGHALPDAGEDRQPQADQTGEEDIAGDRIALPGDIEDQPASDAGQKQPAEALPVEFEFEFDSGPSAFAGHLPDVPAGEEPALEPAAPVIAQEREVGVDELVAESEPALSLPPEEPADNPQPFAGLVTPAGGLDEIGRLPRAAVEPSGTRSLLPWAAGIVVLGLLAVLQAGYVFRTDLARFAPASRPLIEKLCTRLGCVVPYPRDADLIQVESTSLNPEAGGDARFRLTVSLRNKADYPQAWPHLELTLTDRFDIALARRILRPADWLPPASAGQPAFQSRDDVTGSVVVATSGLQAVGYRLYAFYP